MSNFVSKNRLFSANILLKKDFLLDIKKGKYKLEEANFAIELTTPRAFLEGLITKAEEDKKTLQNSVSAEHDSFSAQLTRIEAEKEMLISSADVEEKNYQKYLADLAEWDEKRLAIIGDKDTEGSIEFYKSEINYIDTMLATEYSELVEERYSITKRLYEGIKELSKIYQTIYSPVYGEYHSCWGTSKTAFCSKRKFFERIQYCPNHLEPHQSEI